MFKCDCGGDAVSKIVRKEGPNKGRSFYVCPSGSCKFFKWATPGTTNPPPTLTQQPPNTSSLNNNNNNGFPDKSSTNRPNSTHSANNTANSNLFDDDFSSFDFSTSSSSKTNAHPTISNSTSNSSKTMSTTTTSTSTNSNNNTNNSTRQTFQKPSMSVAASGSKTIPKCKHDKDAILLKVKKEGPNQGKLFWSCTEKEESCQFFEWLKGNENDYLHLLNVNPNKQKQRKDSNSEGGSVSSGEKRKSSYHIEFEICTLDVNSNHELSVRDFDKDPNESVVDGSNTEDYSKMMQNSLALRILVSKKIAVKVSEILTEFNGLNKLKDSEKDETEDEKEKMKKVDLYFEYKNYSAILKTIKKHEIAAKCNIVEIPDFVIRLLKSYSTMTDKNSNINPWKRIPQQLQDSFLPFQKVGVEFGIKKEGKIMISDEMGLGKTIQCIAIATHFANDWPLWIVCPGSLKANWRKEILKWIGGQTVQVDGTDEFITSLQINVIDNGSQVNKGFSLINIISYDLLAKDNVIALVEKEFEKKKKGVIVCDESHLLKSLSSKRSQSLIPLLENATRTILASGTSCMSRPIELYSQIKSIMGKNTIKQLEFGYRYCGLTQKPRYDSDYKGSSRLSELYCLLSNTIMIRRLKRDVLTELPPKKRSKYYLQVKEEDLKKINGVGGDTKKKFYQSDWSKIQKDRDVVAKYVKTAEAKIDGIKAFLRKIIPKKGKFLIFAHHRSVMNAIEETVKYELSLLTKYSHSTVSDDILEEDLFDTKSSVVEDEIEDFEDTEEVKRYDYIRIDGDTKDREGLAHYFRSTENCLVAILSMNVAGCGLNFVPCSTVVFAELSWNPALLNQCEDRCHRIGQRGAYVDITYLLAKKTLDDFMWDLLTKKADITDLALNGQKEEKSSHLTRSVEDITTPKKKTLSLGGASIEKYLKPSPTTSSSTVNESTSSSPPNNLDDSVIILDDDVSLDFTSKKKEEQVDNDKKNLKKRSSSTITLPNNTKKKILVFPQQKNTLFSYCTKK